MKAQLAFEDFIIGFLMFFALASTVFLFINNGGGIGIDFFNTTIYQEDRFQLDFVYLTIYENDQVDTSKYSFNDDTLNLEFSFRRTNLPAGDYLAKYSNMPVNITISWQNFTAEEGLNAMNYTYTYLYTYRVPTGQDETTENALRGEEYTISKALTDVNEGFISLKRTGCKSNLTFRVDIVSEYFSETALNNNEYIIPLDYCFYDPIDLSLDMACIPSTPESSVCKSPLTHDEAINYPHLLPTSAQLKCWSTEGGCNSECQYSAKNQNIGYLSGCYEPGDATTNYYTFSGTCSTDGSGNCYLPINQGSYNTQQSKGALCDGGCSGNIQCSGQNLLGCLVNNNFCEWQWGFVFLSGTCSNKPLASCSQAPTPESCPANLGCAWAAQKYQYTASNPVQVYESFQECEWQDDNFNISKYNPYIIKIKLSTLANQGKTIDFKIKANMTLPDQEVELTITNVYTYALSSLEIQNIGGASSLTLSPSSSQQMLIDLRDIKLGTESIEWRRCDNQDLKIIVESYGINENDYSNNIISSNTGWCI
jgi:hypothetical protein